jgi:hypothetical protein
MIIRGASYVSNNIQMMIQFHGPEILCIAIMHFTPDASRSGWRRKDLVPVVGMG